MARHKHLWQYKASPVRTFPFQSICKMRREATASSLFCFFSSFFSSFCSLFFPLGFSLFSFFLPVCSLFVSSFVCSLFISLGTCLLFVSVSPFSTCP